MNNRHLISFWYIFQWDSGMLRNFSITTPSWGEARLCCYGYGLPPSSMYLSFSWPECILLPVLQSVVASCNIVCCTKAIHWLKTLYLRFSFIYGITYCRNVKFQSSIVHRPIGLSIINQFATSSKPVLGLLGNTRSLYNRALRVFYQTIFLKDSPHLFLQPWDSFCSICKLGH